jgi:uncharacterized membrane protein YeaQ/YmgE (transglycosylase-associated protein family)
MKFLFGILIGGLTGILAVLIHAWGFPLGILIAVIGSYVVTYLLGQYFGSRIAKIGFTIGWIAIILRASLCGNSDEVLVSNNTSGNLLLTLGFLIVLIGIGARV